MSHPRLPILQALRAFKADDEAWGELIRQWPSTDLDEGTAWLDVLPLPTGKYGYGQHSVSVYEALEDKFGQALWNQERQGAPWVHHALQTWKGLPLSLSADELRPRCEMVAFFLRGTDTAWRDRVRDQGAWVAWATAWLSRTEAASAREALIEQIWQGGWVPLDARVNERALAVDFRHPAEIKGWLAAGGDPAVCGWDPAHPGDPLWAVWHRNNPQLRDLLMERVPEADALRQAVAPQRMKRAEEAVYQLKNRSGRVRAQQWWDTLTADPDWMLFRHGGSQTPLWMTVLSHCPPVLPMLCKAAQEDARVREQLQATNALGLGVWHVLLSASDSRSLTRPLLEQLEAWVPPSRIPDVWIGSTAYAKRAEVDIHGSPSYGLHRWSHGLNEVLPLECLLGDEAQQRRWLNDWNRSDMRLAWANFENLGSPRARLSPELAAAHDLVRLDQSLSTLTETSRSLQYDDAKRTKVKQALEEFRTTMGNPLPPHWEPWVKAWRNKLSATSASTPHRLSIGAKDRELIEAALELVEIRARQNRGLAQQSQLPSAPRRHRHRA